jgi:hypothetical protein
MTSTTPAGARTRRQGWLVVAATFLLIAVACLEVGLHGHLHPLAGPVGPQLPPPAAVGGASVPAVPQVARSQPTAIGIPAIGLLVSLSELGLNPDGTVEVPTDVAQPGWFHLGPSPGQAGSAVILGHVDSYLGPGVFFKLPQLIAGDKVDVSLADGVTAHFVVDTVVMYAKAQFPTSLVYAPHGYSALQLVTCGGTFDPETGHYLSNVVVYTSLVSTTPAPSPVTVAGDWFGQN